MDAALTPEQKKLRDDYFASYPNLIALVIKLMPGAVAAMRGRRGMTFDEIESIAWEGVMNAVRKYQPPGSEKNQAGASFATYASNAIRNQISAEWTHTNAKTRKPESGKVINLKTVERKKELGGLHWAAIADRRTTEAENNEEQERIWALRLRVRFALDEIDKRDARVIRLRFGIPDSDELTLEEVGQEIGLTKERIRQLQNRAFNKLKPKLETAWKNI